MQNTPLFSLRHAVLLSLWIDQKADTYELPAGAHDTRGWWGDSFSARSRKLGSKLWLLERGKMDLDTIEKAQTYIKDALQWLIDDHILTKIVVTASEPTQGTAQFTIQLTGTEDDHDLIRMQWSEGSARIFHAVS